MKMILQGIGRIMAYIQQEARISIPKDYLPALDPLTGKSPLTNSRISYGCSSMLECLCYRKKDLRPTTTTSPYILDRRVSRELWLAGDHPFFYYRFSDFFF